MPLIIPDDIDHYTTAGEEIFCRFLRTVAKPDDRYIVWYSPDINDSEPDFILYNPDVGLIVFEVKDWTIDQIREVNPKTFKVRFGFKEESRTNPHEQARGYVHNLMECLRSDGRLVNKDGFAQGKPKIPISHGVVFPNINSYEYKERFTHDGIIPLAKILFFDDLDPHSELCERLTGDKASTKNRIKTTTILLLKMPLRRSCRSRSATTLFWLMKGRIFPTRCCR